MGQILNWSEAFAGREGENQEGRDGNECQASSNAVISIANEVSKKAAEDPDKSGLAAARTPKRYREIPRATTSARFWSAAVLCRFPAGQWG
jgi:hypothetical protein